MSGKGQKTTSSTQQDPADQNYITAMRNAAISNAGQGNQLSGQAQSGLAATQAAGNAGANAISSGNYGQFMNPYQQSVINPMLQQFAQQNQGTVNQVDAGATAAGAFGGSRSGVAEGTALAQNQMNQAQQLGNLEYQGFGQATNQAMQAANLGMGASNSLAQLGQSNALLPGQIMQQGQGGSTGSTTTNTASSNPWGALLGLAGTVGGAVLGGPAGAAAGGSVGSALGGENSASGMGLSPQNFGFGAS